MFTNTSLSTSTITFLFKPWKAILSFHRLGSLSLSTKTSTQTSLFFSRKTLFIISTTTSLSFSS